MRNISLFIFLLLAITCKAQVFQIGQLWYNVTDGEELTLEVVAGPEKYSGLSYDVPMRVDYEGHVYIVTAIGDHAFADCDELASVILPQSIQHIGEGAFLRCGRMNEIILPDHLLSVGNWAFSGSALQKIEFPATTQYIGKGCCANCRQLLSAVVKAKMRELPENMFLACWNLNAVRLPELLTIGASAFEQCRSLREVSFPATLRTISRSAFSGCVSLKNVSFPAGLTTIGQQAFWGCKSLTEVSVPSSVTTVDYAAFADCVNIRTATLSQSLETLGGWVFNRCSSLETCAIPTSQKELAPAIFNKCTSLNQIDIPNSVVRTGYSVFGGCTSVKSINFGSGLRVIGDETFYNLDAVKTIVIPENVDSIGRDAFENCSAVETLSIPSKVQTIALNAFRDCLSLREVYSAMENPCELPELGFADATFQSAALYVPQGTESVYKNKNFWKKFTRILPFDFTRINSVHDNLITIKSMDNGILVKNVPLLSVVSLYDENGRMIACQKVADTETSFTVPQGFYLVKTPTCLTKIMVR